MLRPLFVPEGYAIDPPGESRGASVVVSVGGLSVALFSVGLGEALIDFCAFALRFEGTGVLVSGQAGAAGPAELSATNAQTISKGIVTKGDALLRRGPEVSVPLAKGPKFAIVPIDKLSDLSAFEAFELFDLSLRRWILQTVGRAAIAQ